MSAKYPCMAAARQLSSPVKSPTRSQSRSLGLAMIIAWWLVQPPSPETRG